MKIHSKRLLSALFASYLAVGSFTPIYAAPMPVISGKLGISQPLTQEARYRGRRYSGYRRNNGFPAAALGIFALGTAAAISSQRRDSYDCGYYDGGCGTYNSGYGGYGGGYYGRSYYGGYGGRGYGGRGYYGRSYGYGPGGR